MQLCKCGCGQDVKRFYRPGHNPKSRRCEDLKSRLLKGITVNASTECWEWNKGVNRQGYGRIQLINRKGARAHRAAYEVFKGQIPQGMCVCHKCDNRKCINPDHLFLGTYKDNYRDSKEKGRNAKGEKISQAKLTEEQARFVKYDSQEMSSKELSKQFGVCTSTIRKIRCANRGRMRLWAWL